MKKLVLIVITAAIMIPFFNSCKKGEEDPFLSLKSRDKRLQGEWTLKAYDETSASKEVSNVNNNGTASSTEEITSTTVSYDGTKLKTVVTKNYKDVGSQTYTAQTIHTYYTPLTMSWTIEKGGYVTEEVSYPNNTTAGTFVISSSPVNSAYMFGIYNPYDSSTDDGTYNEQLNTNVTQSSSEKNEFYWHWVDNDKSKSCLYIENWGLFEVVKLSSKEMILKHIQTNNDYDSYNSSGTWTYSSDDTDEYSHTLTITLEKK